MQTEQKIFELRKRRDFGSIIADTFVYFRKNMKPLVRSILIIAGPFMLLSAIYTGMSQVNLMDFSPEEGYFSTILANTLISNFFMLMAMVLIISTTHAYVRLDAENTSGNELKIEKVWQAVKKMLFKCLGILLVSFLFMAVIGGTFGLIFYTAGPIFFGFTVFLSIFFLIYLGMRFSFVYAAGLLDDYNAFDSFSRSWYISNGFSWNNLGIIFIFGILVVTISSFAAMPAMIFTIFGALHGASEINPIWKFVVIAIQTVGTFIALIGYALPFIAYVLQYYSAVEKSEGIGLLQRIETLNLKTEDNNNWGEETY